MPLVEEGKAQRIAGGREGKRKLPDRYSLAAAEEEEEPAGVDEAGKVPGNGSADRLRPGGLDELVLAYMHGHPEEAPFGPKAIAKGLGRSSGAVGNCLARLVGAGEKVTQVGERPRRYALKEGSSGRCVGDGMPPPTQFPISCASRR